jgi:pantoate--beta-alanine ligase
MKVIKNIDEMMKLSDAIRAENKTIGFVPTMGYLHDGHISLVKESVQNNDITIVSIYVNPTQFGVNEDLDKYPSDIENDMLRLEKSYVDYLFLPQSKEVYPLGFSTYVSIDGEFTNKLCGKSRPTHFRGVTTIVTKLFNIVKPTRSYFGKKDAQQFAIITRMVKDLNMDVEVIGMPIIRELDGLAMSSRNVYLSIEQRQSAPNIYKGLLEVQKNIDDGKRDILFLSNIVKNSIEKVADSRVDYIEFVNFDDFTYATEIKGKILLAVAVFVGKARLIDNIILEV